MGSAQRGGPPVAFTVGWGWQAQSGASGRAVQLQLNLPEGLYCLQVLLPAPQLEVQLSD